MDLRQILASAMTKNTSDIILTAGRPPMLRVNGSLTPDGTTQLTNKDVQQLVYSVISEEQKAEFEQHNELDLAIEFPDSGRFRVNVFRQMGNIGAALRPIMSRIPTLESLYLPQAAKDFCNLPSGLVLVTGPTGSGKSTSLAAMINHINLNRRCHIITVEDPIEFVHPHKRSVVSQRELGSNTLSFSNALRSALREDPDVILVGEMRDIETMKLAIAASETGHLVFSTLHTNSAYESINRIVGSFPGDVQQTIRMQLSASIRGVISQRLIPSYMGSGRVLAYEVLLGSTPVKRCIKEDKTDQIISTMQTSRGEGMITMDQCLEDLVVAKRITYDDAFKNAADKKDFQKRLENRVGKANVGSFGIKPLPPEEQDEKKPGKK